ncbi:MAG: glycosyltransferase [Vampirovibrio sp.]|nr:glycosyltransferase [Vampirovibrio sp.]
MIWNRLKQIVDTSVYRTVNRLNGVQLLGRIGVLFSVAFVLVNLILLSAEVTAFADPGSGGFLQQTQQSISDLASLYYGSMTRELLPEDSLFGTSWFTQAIISGVLVLVFLLIAKWMPRHRKVVMGLTFVVILRHLLWRGFETMDTVAPSSTVVAWIVYGAEILAAASLLLGFLQMWNQTDREAVPLDKSFPKGEDRPSVDVFVCTYNEPLSVLYRTLVGCKNIDYENKTVYLLDDGNRSEMAELAKKLKIQYIGREKNTHAKAGNLNNALEQTSGDLSLIFDADHVPCKSFLKEVVGFFINDNLAYVQTPQHFFTQDPFQRNLLATEMNNEQDLFFHVIQPGNDAWDAAFFAGSGAIFRRKALEEIDGFATETITEDVHTGLRLHAKGWKSIYYNKDLAAGLAQDTFADFIKQRLRWTKGMTQILFFDHPLLKSGLTFGQRLCYFSGIWYFFSGLARMIFLAAPIAFLLFGVTTINAGYVEVLVYYLPSFVFLVWGYPIVTRGLRQNFWGEVYDTAMCTEMFFTNFTTVFSSLFTKGRAKFRVTPKGGVMQKMRFDLRVVLPQVFLTLLILMSLAFGVWRLLETPDYKPGVFINMFWACYNLVLLLGGIYVAQERPQYRMMPRIFKEIRSELHLQDGTVAIGYTTNISESGVAMVFEEPVPVSGVASVKLLDWDINESTMLKVQPIRSTIDQDNRHYVGFNVIDRTDKQHQKLICHMFGTPGIWMQENQRTSTFSSFLHMLTTPFRVLFTKEETTRRRVLRFRTNLSCVVDTGNGQDPLIGFSDDVSETGIAVYLKKSIDLGTKVTARIQWSNGNVTELPSEVKYLKKIDADQYKLGLEFLELTKQQQLHIIQQMYRPREGLVRVAPGIQKTVNCVLSVVDNRDATGQPGKLIRGYTWEMSEMGAVISLQENIPLRRGMTVSLKLYWDKQDSMDLEGEIQDIQPPADGKPALLLVYFLNLSLNDVEEISRRIHVAEESHRFETLTAI